jgi:hypothetical protein
MFSSLRIPWTRGNWYKIWIMIAIEFAIIWSFFMFGFYAVDFVEKHSKTIHRYIYIPSYTSRSSGQEVNLSSDGRAMEDGGQSQQPQQLESSEKIEANDIEIVNINDTDQIEENTIAKSVDIELANEEIDCRGKPSLFTSSACLLLISHCCRHK